MRYSTVVPAQDEAISENDAIITELKINTNVFRLMLSI